MPAPLVTLTAVASLLIGHHVPVKKVPPPWVGPWPVGCVGLATWPPERIAIRYPIPTVQRRWMYVVAFAHEILHIEHKTWPHWKVYREAPRYAYTVRRTLRRLSR